MRGKVLPVGGIKEKILAAKRAGIKELILCQENKKDIEEIKPDYLKGLAFHYVDDIRQVVDLALLKEKVANPLFWKYIGTFIKYYKISQLIHTQGVVS